MFPNSSEPGFTLAGCPTHRALCDEWDSTAVSFGQAAEKAFFRLCMKHHMRC
jgi:hypothetical protein